MDTTFKTRVTQFWRRLAWLRGACQQDDIGVL